jgi:hypothetical protein
VSNTDIEKMLKSATARERVASVVWFWTNSCDRSDPERLLKGLGAACINAADERTGWEHIAPAWLEGYRKSLTEKVTP